MAITLAQQHQLAANIDFQYRVRQAMADKAIAIMAEDPATLGGGNDELQYRLNLARRVLNNPMGVAQTAAYILATADALTTVDPSAISDAAYLNFVASNWSALAGYNPLYVEGGA